MKFKEIDVTESQEEPMKIKKDNKEDPRVNPPRVDVVIIDGMK